MCKRCSVGESAVNEKECLMKVLVAALLRAFAK
jgi:hypothetical protein